VQNGIKDEIENSSSPVTVPSPRPAFRNIPSQRRKKKNKKKKKKKKKRRVKRLNLAWRCI